MRSPTERDPILSCSVKPHEMEIIKDYMVKHELDGAKLVRLAVSRLIDVELDGTRHRSLVGVPPMPTPQQTQFIRNNLKLVDRASVCKTFATAPN